MSTMTKESAVTGFGYQIVCKQVSYFRSDNQPLWQISRHDFASKLVLNMSSYLSEVVSFSGLTPGVAKRREFL